MKFVPLSLTDELQEHSVTSCEDLFRPVRPIHTFSVASLLERSLGYFGVILKLNIRAWSEEQNHLRNLRTKPLLGTFDKLDVIYKQFLPEGKTSNFITGAGKFIEAYFESWGHNFRGWYTSLCMTMLLLILP
jgi:hypothetical protein